MKRHALCKNGFTLVEIMIVVAIIGLLAAIAIPNFVTARQTSQTNACINNLRQIDGAKQQWALETGQTALAVPVATNLQVYLGRGDQGSLARVYCPLAIPPAPMGGYTVNAVGTPPVCNQYDATQHPASLN
ncbi:MAG: type II secretion system protein [Verrucomicrobiota bacterium]|jgi:prepilin-type N-terminal cleavage/methylation domain-containing protein